jgi:hypothetical protein
MSPVRGDRHARGVEVALDRRQRRGPVIISAAVGATSGMSVIAPVLVALTWRANAWVQPVPRYAIVMRVELH